MDDFPAPTNPGLPHGVFIPVLNLKIDVVDLVGSAAEALLERLENLNVRKVLGNRPGVIAGRGYSCREDVNARRGEPVM